MAKDVTDYLVELMGKVFIDSRNVIGRNCSGPVGLIAEPSVMAAEVIVYDACRSTRVKGGE
jgi:hypothetical protein